MLVALGLTTAAEQLYRRMLEEPDWGVAELGEHLDLAESEVRATLDELFELSLVRNSAERPGRLHVVGPQVGLRLALIRQQAELARQQHQVAESRAAIEQLIEDYRPGPPADAGSVVQVRGIDAVRDRLTQLALETEFEILTLMPGGAQSAASLDHARRQDAILLGRGVRIRTIGLESIRNDAPTLEYARFLTAGGAEFRTSPVLPPRMILMDRRAALVPVDPAATGKGVLCLSGVGLIAPMLSLFEQVWEIATPFGATTRPDRRGLSPQERALLRLLAHGLTDEAAAARLSISHRTARRLMAALMERLGATSRFEAGLKAAQKGWL